MYDIVMYREKEVQSDGVQSILQREGIRQLSGI